MWIVCFISQPGSGSNISNNHNPDPRPKNHYPQSGPATLVKLSVYYSAYCVQRVSNKSKFPPLPHF